ncbi:hypothetical protein [Dietzia maris]|uniref:hypothetical protein n=1 Tax=Dietzia maris TaxID=37915 RepID=UPI0037CA9AD8
MDHRDYTGDWTYRIMEESRRQMMAQLIPDMIIQPTFDVEKLIEPPVGVFDQLQEQLSKQSPSLVEIALQGTSGMHSSLSEQISRVGTNAFDVNFGNGLGAFDQAQAALELTFKPPTISEWIYGTEGFRSVFDTIGPSALQIAAGLIDSKPLMGRGFCPGTSSTLAEQWNLGTTGVLSNFGGVFESLRESLDFEQSLKSSGFAQALLVETRKLREDQANRLADVELTEEADIGVAELLEANQDLSTVATFMQRYFTEYFGYSPEQSYNLVRRVIWVIVLSGMVYGFAQTAGTLQTALGLVLGITGKSILDSTSSRTADKLIPESKPYAVS